MQIGWIDFSKEERNKVIEVMSLLNTPGAVDELGIGIIRDAFANTFFPGTSTVQTRAKYFLIVPYLLKEAVDGRYKDDVNQILRKIDEEEKHCAEIMVKGDIDGVIGVDSLPGWVVRPPSNIYWNGIKQFGIFRRPELSIKEYVAQSIIIRKTKDVKSLGNRVDDADEGEKDDKDAGDLASLQFWKLQEVYDSKWRNNLTIGLLPKEATFLRSQILMEMKGSLLELIMRENIPVGEIGSFKELTEIVKNKAPNELNELMALANQFNELVMLARIRYNVILSDGNNELAKKRWAEKKDDIDTLANVNLSEVFSRLNIKNADLKTFLKALKSAFLANDIGEADKLIEEREARIKGGARAKLKNREHYDNNAWIGGYDLDYRYASAKRIIIDIYTGEVSGV